MTDEQADIGAGPVPDMSEAPEAAAAVPEASQTAMSEAAAAVPDVTAADMPAAAAAAPDVAPAAVATAAGATAAAAAVAAPQTAPVAPVAVPPPADPGWSAYVPQAPAAGAGPVAGWQYAGFWIRAVAYIIDGFILGFFTSIVWVVVLVIAGGIGIGAVASSADANGQITDSQAAVLAVGFVTAMLFLAVMSILVTFFYFTLLWVKRGATFGQSLLGIRIARASDGGPIGWGTAIVRYIMMLISFWIFYLGVIWVAFEPRKRGWHDMVAGTLAVRRG